MRVVEPTRYPAITRISNMSIPAYWYLEAAPELMALAGQRLERHLGAEQ